MTYSFEIFDLGLHRRAFWSNADLERAGMLAELTHAEVSSRQFSSGANRAEMIESIVQVDVS